MRDEVDAWVRAAMGHPSLGELRSLATTVPIQGGAWYELLRALAAPQLDEARRRRSWALHWVLQQVDASEAPRAWVELSSPFVERTHDVVGPFEELASLLNGEEQTTEGWRRWAGEGPAIEVPRDWRPASLSAVLVRLILASEDRWGELLAELSPGSGMLAEAWPALRSIAGERGQPGPSSARIPWSRGRERSFAYAPDEFVPAFEWRAEDADPVRSLSAGGVAAAAQVGGVAACRAQAEFDSASVLSAYLEEESARAVQEISGEAELALLASSSMSRAERLCVLRRLTRVATPPVRRTIVRGFSSEGDSNGAAWSRLMRVGWTRSGSVLARPPWESWVGDVWRGPVRVRGRDFGGILTLLGCDQVAEVGVLDLEGRYVGTDGQVVLEAPEFLVAATPVMSEKTVQGHRATLSLPEILPTTRGAG